MAESHRDTSRWHDQWKVYLMLHTWHKLQVHQLGWAQRFKGRYRNASKRCPFLILVLFVSSMFFTGKLLNSPREDFKMFGCLVILSGVKSWNPWWNWEAITQFHALPAAVVAQMCTSIGGTEWSFSCAFIILYCKTSESIWDTLAYWYVYIIRQSSFQRNSFMQQKTLQ